jgi:DNA polymerase III subunit delta'
MSCVPPLPKLFLKILPPPPEMPLQTSVLGQTLALELLERSLASARIAPAYLFVGQEGIGKAMVARAFSEALLHSFDGRVARSNHPDFLWIEPTFKKGDKLLTRNEALAEGALPRSQPQIRMEQVRNIIQFLSRPAVEAQRRVVVLENAQTLGDGAANALLKVLEEPGAATLILTVPELRVVLTTVVSRCQKIPFVRLSDQLVQKILAEHNMEAPPEIVAMSQGSPGRAMQLLEWLTTVPPDLLAALSKWSQNPLDLRGSLSLARQVDEALTVEAQVLLVDYLQHLVWHSGQSQHLAALEKLRTQLLSYVSPRLAWEVSLATLKVEENRL